MAEAVRFVVFARAAGQWSEAGEREDETRAVNQARELALKDANDGAMVLREGVNRFGRTTRTTVYYKDKTKPLSPEREAIAQLEAASRCESPEDLFAWPARATMLRLFSRHLQRGNLTPTELLHLAPELDKLLANELGIAQAVLKVADLQTVGKAAETGDRRDLLYDLIDEVATRAQAAQAIELPDPKGVGLAKFRIAANAANKKQLSAEFVERVGLARELAKVSNAWGKLGLLLDLVEAAERDGAPLDLFEPFVGDLLAREDVVEDMFGPRDTVAGMIDALIDFADGKPPAPIPTKPSTQLLAPQAQRIAARLERGDFNDVADALHDQGLRLLKAAHKLGPSGEGPTEEAAMRAVLRRLTALDRPLSSEAAGALLRHCLRVAKLNDDQADRGLRAVFHWLGEPGRQIRYGLALATTKFAKSAPEPLDAQLEKALNGTETLEALLPGLGARPMLRAATSLHRSLGQAPLGIVTRKALCARVEDLLDDYIARTNPVAAILDESGPFYRKALTMVRLCAPGSLPPGRVLEKLRKTVVEQLRATGYERSIAAEIKDQTLRELAHRDMLNAMRSGGFL